MYVHVCTCACRLLEVMGSRIIDVHPIDKPVAELMSQKMYRIEVSGVCLCLRLCLCVCWSMCVSVFVSVSVCLYLSVVCVRI